MVTDSVDAEQLFVSLDDTWSELLKLVASTDASIINSIPFRNSWSAAQLATHVAKSNRAIAQGLQMEGKPAERMPDKGVPHLRQMFLDFNTKYKSPEFIIPEKKDYDKDEVIAALKRSIGGIRDMHSRVSLTEIINLPLFGEVTKLELLHFVLYHTQRHNHQLKNILKELNEKL